MIYARHMDTEILSDLCKAHDLHKAHGSPARTEFPTSSLPMGGRTEAEIQVGLLVILPIWRLLYDKKKRRISKEETLYMINFL